MSYKLYYADRSASMTPRVIFEETGVDYELIETSIRPDKPQDPELLALNPSGWIPVLIWQERAFYECGAIVIFLCDHHPEANLAPAINDPDRGLYLQWLFYFSSSLQNAYQMTYYPNRFVDAETDYAKVKQRSITRLAELWQVVDDAIGDQDWLLGNRFSAADIYLFMLTTWLSKPLHHPPVTEFKNVNRIALKVMQRPSVRKVYERYISDWESGQIREPWPVNETAEPIQRK